MASSYKATQCEKILRHMQVAGSITAFDAMKEYGCMRLAARIRDLKGKGHRITKVTETRNNRFGDAVSYARYSLEENNGQEDMCHV